MIFLSKDKLGISVLREVLLKIALQEDKLLSNFILKEITAHLACCNHFMEDINQYKNNLISQLFRPPRTPLLQNTYHWLLSTVNADLHNPDLSFTNYKGFTIAK